MENPVIENKKMVGAGSSPYRPFPYLVRVFLVLLPSDRFVTKEQFPSSPLFQFRIPNSAFPSSKDSAFLISISLNSELNYSELSFRIQHLT